MSILGKRKLIIALILCLLLIPGAVSCSVGSNSDTDAADVSADVPTSPSSDPSEEQTDEPMNAAPPTPAAPSPAQNLVEYDGAVEHLFFHEVIAYPQLAFDGDSMQAGYDRNMVTVNEFNKMLESMYNNNFILVNLNDIWSEYVNENGENRMQKNLLMLPEGKKPLVLSFDDISFYEYMSKDGFMSKLIIGEDGDIWATGVDPNGNTVITQDLTVVTILDKFVKKHPDFSFGGVKGCIALTGYEGILGYRTQTDRNDNSEEFRLNRMQEVARVRPVIQKLHENGWYFASHSYAHIDLESESLEKVEADALRWLDEVGSLVGETKIFIDPFGTRLDGGDVYDTGPAFRFYQELGFRIFASVGIEPFSRIKPDIAAVVCDRMHADGITLRNSRERYMKFYDAAEVFDPMRPEAYGKSW